MMPRIISYLRTAT